MTRNNSIKSVGVTFIIIGLILILAAYLPQPFVLYSSLGLLALAGIFEGNYYYKSYRKGLKADYHLVLAIFYFSFALLLFFYGQNIYDFLSYLTYFTLSFGLLEFVFAVLGYQRDRVWNFLMIANNLLSGSLNTMAACFILYTQNYIYFSLVLLGIVFILGGAKHFIYRSLFNVKRLLKFIEGRTSK